MILNDELSFRIQETYDLDPIVKTFPRKYMILIQIDLVISEFS